LLIFDRCIPGSPFHRIDPHRHPADRGHGADHSIPQAYSPGCADGGHRRLDHFMPAAAITGLLLLSAFFLLGTLATAWRREEKDKLEPRDPHPRGRTTGQVLANAGVAQILALLVGIFPSHTHLLQMMLAASFAAATADTLASELGTVYGRRFYNCLTWKAIRKG